MNKNEKTIYVIVGFNIVDIEHGTATATVLTKEGTYEILDKNDIDKYRIFDSRSECEELISRCFTRCISYGIKI